MAGEKEAKMILEREYTVPLRKKWLDTPKYKRVPKAIKALKQFIVRHMKVEDEQKVKLDRYLNEELWFRGIRKPPVKIKVKVKKFEDGIIKAELVEIPQALKWKKEKEERMKIETEKKMEEKSEEKKTGEEKKAEEEKKVEEKKEAKEKEKATIEAGLKEAEKMHREIRHEIAEKKGIKKPLARKALKK